MKLKNIHKRIFVTSMVLAAMVIAACSSGPGVTKQAAGPAYTGDGGKGMSIAILPPRSRGLAEQEDYLPALVQGEFVSNFTGYSAISVLDRVQLDNQYAELLSGYYEDDAEAGMDLGRLTPTDYIMGGSITKTATGYALQIQITRTAAHDKTTAASYSGACSAAELDNLSGVRRASLDLLQKMGVELSERAKNELAGAAAGNQVTAQTALAKGITAQREGNVAEAFTQYFKAGDADRSLTEVSKRLALASTQVSGGSIGENVRNLIQQREEWKKLFDEAAAYYNKHIPFYYEISFGALEQGKIDYNRNTVEITAPCSVNPVLDEDAINALGAIGEGFQNTGHAEEWKLTMPVKWGYALGRILNNMEQQQRNRERQQLLMERRQQIGEGQRRNPMEEQVWKMEEEQWNREEQQDNPALVCLQVSLLNDKGKVVGKAESNRYFSDGIIHFNWGSGVKAKDITDNMSIRLDAVAIIGLYEDYYNLKFESAASLQARGLVRVVSGF